MENEKKLQIFLLMEVPRLNLLSHKIIKNKGKYEESKHPKPLKKSSSGKQGRIKIRK